MSRIFASNDLPVRRIISGGQTGVDRAALDVAMELGIPHGGWCPRGRKAEDGVIDARYQLHETRSAKYHIRTRRNVRDSDGTLVLFRDELTGGTALTARYAQMRGKPCLLVNAPEAAPQVIRQWLIREQIETLNVAGPREITSPGIYEEARRLLVEIFRSDPEDEIACPK